MRAEWIRRKSRTSPEFFRRHLVLPGSAGETAKDGLPQAPRLVRFADVVQRWQLEDFRALDPAWRHLAGCGPPAAVRRAWIERPRGHSKTFDTAVSLAWIVLFARRPLRGLAAAADRDQAGLIHDALLRLVDANQQLCGRLELQRHRVQNRETGTRLDVISSDVASSYGALPDFVICDELCHWPRAEFWESLFSSSAKRPECVLVVLTNAGIGRGWQWSVREAARESPGWHFSSLTGPQAPWLAADFLQEQRRLLPEPVYLRLWENRWQHSDGAFVTLAEAEACRDASLRRRTHGEPGVSYIAAIDYAEKH
ncbi:MAG: phage terminase family protein, partial [Planctomycetes bacterium]|nr:phage terminase family protein [Planctomycetota bacterium]